MKSVIIKQHTKDGLKKIFHIKEKDGKYSGQILTDLIGLIEITVVDDKNKRTKI